MKRMGIWIIIIWIASSAQTTLSQSLTDSYKFAVGLRAGETSGLTFKFKTRNANSVELLAGFWQDWYNLTALFEINAKAFDVDGLNWYYGGGGHISFLTNEYRKSGRYYNRGEDFAIGIDGIVGIEYKIPPIPFAVSFDLKPLFEVYRSGDVYVGIDPGFGIKFTF